MALACTQPVSPLVDTNAGAAQSLPFPASFSPTANAVIVVYGFVTGVTVGFAFAASHLTDDGGSPLTWHLENSVFYSSSNRVGGIWWAVTGANPSASITLTLNVSATGQTPTGFAGVAFQFTGANTNSPIVQTAGASAATTTNATVAMSNPMNANNGYCAAWGGALTSPPVSTPPAGWTETCDVGFTSPNANYSGAYRINGEDGTTSIAFANNATNWGVLAVEVAALLNNGIAAPLVAIW